MGSNEEYLDKLLQSVSNDVKTIAQDEKEYSEDMTDDELLASLIEMYSDELAEFKTEEIIHKDETILEEGPEEKVTEDELIAENIAEEVLVEPAEEIVEEASAVDMPVEVEKPILADYHIPNNNDMLSQSDIEALLSSLQQADDGIDDSTENVMLSKTEVLNEASVVDQETIEEPQMLETSELDELLKTKVDDMMGEADDNLLKEMGIEGMSAEQIDELLSAASAAENSQSEKTATEETNEMDLNDLFGGLNFVDDFDPEHHAGQDMADLLGGMLGGNDDDLAEIGNLLNKADNNEPVDDSNLRNLLDMEDDIGGNDLLNELLQSGNDSVGEESQTDDKSQKGKKKKEKKEKVPKQPKQPKQPKEKKEGNSLWKKITSILFEEDESLDDEKPVKIVGGDGQVNLVDVGENEDILAELMNEDMVAGKKSKKKKDKTKADKNKNKGKSADSEEGEEAIDPKEQARLEKKKQKAEKVAAKKKAKEEKAEADKAFLKAQPSISTKRAMVAFLFALSIMAIVLVIYAFVPNTIDKANARKAYYNKEYYEAYELLQGKELNDSDTILLNKVVCILKMQRKLDSYNNYVKMDKELEALNSLVEAVGLYGESYTYAKALSIDSEIDTIYEEILIILSGKYGISEETAKEILACESDAEYTLRLQYLVEGKNWGSTETKDSEEPMEDVLPEEEEFLEGQ